MRIISIILASLATFAAADTANQIIRRQNWNGTSSVNVNVNVDINIQIVLVCPAGAPALTTTLFSVLYCPGATMFATFGYTYKVTAAGYLTIICPYTIEPGCATTVSHCDCAVATAQTTAVTFTKNNAVSITQVECPTATQTMVVATAGSVSTYTYYAKQETTIVCEECQGQTVVAVGSTNSSRRIQITPTIVHSIAPKVSEATQLPVSPSEAPKAPGSNPVVPAGVSPMANQASQVAGHNQEQENGHQETGSVLNTPPQGSSAGNSIQQQSSGSGNSVDHPNSVSSGTPPSVFAQVNGASSFAASSFLVAVAFSLML